MKSSLPTIILFTIISLGVGFIAGARYQQSKIPNFSGRFNNVDRQNSPRNGMGRNFGGMVNGEVLSADNRTLTVKLADGSSRVVLLSETTNCNRPVPASLDDLKVGTKITVFGSPNQDGSLTANSIQISLPDTK